MNFLPPVRGLISIVQRDWADINTLAIVVRAGTQGAQSSPPPRPVGLALHWLPVAITWPDLSIRAETPGPLRRGDRRPDAFGSIEREC